MPRECVNVVFIWNNGRLTIFIPVSYQSVSSGIYILPKQKL